ncbi:hypothetical protein BDFB_003046 [Asbolus verrucosus]|uniref:Uncharacterized protein n=1 Tax=Asbolus verrucosus TaxID=1661398 RepID=A0A482W7R5_ASBVE|nr:hypothetical protein BDFB_003046 [Asbolus verrucosus]
MVDTFTTSIAANPGFSPPATQQIGNHPNTVTFTFNGSQPYYQQPYNFSWQSSGPAMSGLNQLQHRNALDLLQLQQQLNSSQPYQLKFHLDNQTSTTDLSADSTKVEGSILDDIDSPKSKDKKKVNFAESQATAAQNAEVQVHMCCNCCKREEKKYRCSRKKKGKVRKKDSDETSSDISTEEDIR